MAALTIDLGHPRPGGWTLPDLERFPEKARIEVMDGALLVNPSPTPGHQRMVRRLAAQLERQLPAVWQVETDIDVLLHAEPLDYVTPDLVVFSSTVPLTTRPVLAADVLLVVEVVSPGSRREDRGSKPLAYAESGIAHFWRVESPASGAPAIQLVEHAVARSTPGRYLEIGLHTGQCSLDEPFDLDLDLTALA